MKLTLSSSAPESLINLQTIHLCFLSVFTAACAKMTASIIFIPYFFKTQQKNKKKPKTKQRRWDVSMHRCRFSTGVFVHLSLRRRQLLGASCDTSMSLYPSFYAQSPACCSILHQRVSLPICALNLKKKESCLFSASFIPSFSFHSWTSAAPSAISSAQATFFFLCFLMQTQTSDLEWPAVSVTVKKKKKKKSKGKMLFDGVFEYPTSTDSYNLALLLRISDVGVSIIMREAWRAAYSCYLWCLMQFCYDLFIVSWIMGGHLSCAGVTDCVFSFSGTVMSSFINILSLSFVWLKLMFLSCWLNHAEFLCRTV